MQIMIDFLNSFKSLIKLEKIHTDNNVFKLHYKFTVIMLIVFSILLTSKQYFGDPIDCDVEDQRKDVIDTYCWIYGTYIVKRTLGDEVLPGLGNHEDNKINKRGYRAEIHKDLSPWEYAIKQSADDKEQIITQKYYQWVCIMFCFQALLFYIPRYLWKTWEGGLLRSLVKDLRGPIVTSTWNVENKDRLLNYLLSGSYSHRMYALRFAFCEVLNFINVVCQIILLDWFLTGHFSGYGIAVATYKGINPMTAVFPKLTKCTYYKYGPSGTLQSRDAMCVLPLNIVNEKLFLFLWIWLFLLSMVSFLQLIYRALILCIPQVRIYLLMAHSRYLPKKNASLIIDKMSFGDYFLVYLLGKNLNPIIYKELLNCIASHYKLGHDSSPYNVGFNPEVTALV